MQWLSRSAALVAVLAPIKLWAASCPLCYSKAVSSSAGLLQAFRSGVVILMVPPFLLSVGITVIAYRRRDSFRSEAESPDSDYP